ncbi:hypothetical protein JCM8547_004882 [Rhodosporidiobolus lusitaniae]
MTKLTRSLSKPFVKYIRPHLHSERGITSDSAHALAHQRKLSGGIGSSTLIDDFPHTDEDPLTPSPEPSPFAPASSSSSIAGPSTLPSSSTSSSNPYFDLLWEAPVVPESRQWKECTPVLEDPEGEEAAERSFSRVPERIDEEEDEDERANETFQTAADASFDSSAFGDFDVPRRRVHTWHALELDSTSTFAISPPGSPQLLPQLVQTEEADDSCCDTPSLLEDSSAFDAAASPRDSEDSYGSPSTPNTSFPLSTVTRETSWSPSSSPNNKGKGKQREQAYPFPTSTPTRSTTPFIELVEIAPTPEKDNDERSRRRSLMTSGLGIAFDEDAASSIADEEEEAEEEVDPSIRSMSAHSHYSVVSSSNEALLYPGRSEDDLRPRRERVNVVEPSLDSYNSDVYPDAAHYNTYTRRPRREHPSLFGTDDPDALPFPAISPAELVTSLLSYPNGSTSHLPEAPYEAPEIPPPPRHTRPFATPLTSPVASPDVSPQPPSTSYFPSPLPPLAPTPSVARAPSMKRNASSPIPFSAMIPLTPPPVHGAPTPILRAQASDSSLFTWDMAHLPAPRTPREQPFKVRALSLLLPTAFLGGGRGTGLYGDQYGAIERKAPEPTASSSTNKHRSLSVMSISGLTRSLSTSTRDGRRRSLFGLASSPPAAPAIAEEDESPVAGPSGFPSSSSFDFPSHSLPALPAASSSTPSGDLKIDEFAVFAPAPSGASTLRPKQRRRPQTAPGLGERHGRGGAGWEMLENHVEAGRAEGGMMRRSLSTRFGGGGRKSSRKEVHQRAEEAEVKAGAKVFPPPETPKLGAEEDEAEEGEKEKRKKLRKERRRSSLGVGLLGSVGGGGRGERKEEEQEGQEELDQWVAVSVR